MLRIVIATTRPKALQAFRAALASDSEVHLKHAVSGAEALEATRTDAPQLVIIDADLPDTPPFDLVQKLLMVNAMVNTAVLSPLADEDFHEVSEGLGILSRLPKEPGESDAAELLCKLRKILVI